MVKGVLQSGVEGLAILWGGVAGALAVAADAWGFPASLAMAPATLGLKAAAGASGAVFAGFVSTAFAGSTVESPGDRAEAVTG
jgi:hypothetical protein